MGRRIFRGWGVETVFVALLVSVNSVEALGLKGLGIKVGVDLTQQESALSGTSFDTASLVIGGHLDLGSFIIPKLHLVPGIDVVIQDDLRTFSLNGDARYLFIQNEKTIGYAGAGIGVHLNRFDEMILNADPNFQNNTKISVNIPLGFQRKVSRGLLWFGELKLVIADDQTDSSFRFSVGLTLGAGN